MSTDRRDDLGASGGNKDGVVADGVSKPGGGGVENGNGTANRPSRENMSLPINGNVEPLHRRGNNNNNHFKHKMNHLSSGHHQNHFEDDHDDHDGGCYNDDAGEDEEDYENAHSLRIPRTMELRHAVAIVLGIVIGSGIFVSPVGVLKLSGSFGAAILIWLGCGFVATIGGLCYIELATMIQLSGGDYAYIYHAFGPLVSFLYIWVVLVIILPSAIAVLAQTFSIYLIRSIQEADTCPIGANISDTWAPTFLSLVCVFFLIAVNAFETKWANRVQFVFTGAKMVALGAIIAVGVYNAIVNTSEVVSVWSTPFENSSTNPVSYALSFYVGIFSYAGWNTVTYVTEEIKKPEKNMPRAILIGIPLITLFYIAVNLAYFSSLTFNELVTSDAVAVTLGAKISPALGRLFSAAVMLSTFGAINGCVFVTSRLFFVGARSGCLPAVFALIQVHRKTPITALITLGAISALYIVLGSSIEELMKYESFVEVSFIGVTIAGLVWLRHKWPRKRRPFKVPLVMPILFLVISAFFMFVSLAYSTSESLWGLGLIATGIPVYYLQEYASKSMYCRKISASINLFAQKLFLAAPEEDVPSSPRKNPNRPLPPSTQVSAIAMPLVATNEENDDDDAATIDEGK